jgi:hypothetical protein
MQKAPLRQLCAVLLSITAPSPALAYCRLDELIGYTLTAAKVIIGRIDGAILSDDFEGCERGRVIVFADNTAVRCSGEKFSYSYRPRAYIFSSRNAMKLCVESELYEIGPLREPTSDSAER